MLGWKEDSLEHLENAFFQGHRSHVRFHSPLFVNNLPLSLRRKFGRPEVFDLSVAVVVKLIVSDDLASMDPDNLGMYCNVSQYRPILAMLPFGIPVIKQGYPFL